MSKSQSKSKNPFHLLANPCWIFKLKFDISISPSRLIPSMKNRLSYVKFEAFRVLSSLATSKNRWESNKRGGEGRKGGGKHSKKARRTRAVLRVYKSCKEWRGIGPLAPHLRDETVRCPSPPPPFFLSFSSPHLPSLPRGCAPPYTVVTLVCIIEVAYEACRREDLMLHQRSFVAYHNGEQRDARAFSSISISSSHTYKLNPTPFLLSPRSLNPLRLRYSCNIDGLSLSPWSSSPFFLLFFLKELFWV